jgi:hypothetical protein
MNQNEILKSYIKSNVAPILINFLNGKDIPNSILLPSNVNISELNGHYENDEFLPPSSSKQAILVIDKIDEISKKEQLKFVELLKYRQISTFKLPESTIIIVTAKKINKNTINEEIYSLVAHIER